MSIIRHAKTMFSEYALHIRNTGGTQCKSMIINASHKSMNGHRKKSNDGRTKVIEEHRVIP